MNSEAVEQHYQLAERLLSTVVPGVRDEPTRETSNTIAAAGVHAMLALAATNAERLALAATNAERLALTTELVMELAGGLGKPVGEGKNRIEGSAVSRVIDAAGRMRDAWRDYGAAPYENTPAAERDMADLSDPLASANQRAAASWTTFLRVLEEATVREVRP